MKKEVLIAIKIMGLSFLFIVASCKKIEINPSAEKYFELSYKYYENNDFINSKKLLNSALSLDPNNEKYLLLRGYLRLNLNDLDSAIIDFKKIPKNSIYYCSSRDYLSYCFYLKENYLLTLIYNYSELENCSNLIKVISDRCFYNYQFGFLKNAVNDGVLLECLNSLSPNDYFNLGLAHFELGNNEKSISYLTELINVEPADINALYYLGKNYQNLGNFDSCVFFIQKVYDSIPNFRDCKEIINNQNNIDEK